VSTAPRVTSLLLLLLDAAWQTLYRDVVPSSRRHALRKYETYFHALCWPVPALSAGSVAYLGYSGSLGDPDTWCTVGMPGYLLSQGYLLAFYLPLLLAFTFNIVTYTAVLLHSRERRVSRITSLYLLGFAVVWLPSLVCRLQAAFADDHKPVFVLALLEAVCMPLQGALNALVYGWSLPSIRDVYRTMLLGTDGLNDIEVDVGASRPNEAVSPSGNYSPPSCAWPALQAYGSGAYGRLSCAPAALPISACNGNGSYAVPTACYATAPLEGDVTLGPPPRAASAVGAESSTTASR